MWRAARWVPARDRRVGCRRRCTGRPAVVTRYRFLDAMGEVVAEAEFAQHADALAWAEDENRDENREEDLQRVEYLGWQGDWRWAGALHG
jgi:hypothetical protein